MVAAMVLHVCNLPLFKIAFFKHSLYCDKKLTMYAIFILILRKNFLKWMKKIVN